MIPPLKNKKVVVLGVGNEVRGDDGLGPAVCKALADINGRDIKIVDGSEVPENVSGVIKEFEPDLLLVIDAADFGGRPGETRRVCGGDIEGMSFSTHSLPINVLTDFLREDLPDLEVVFILVQAADVEFGAPVSAEVKAAAEKIEKEIREALLKEE